jgi:hypothetical protein
MADGNQECQEKQAAEQRNGVTYDHFGANSVINEQTFMTSIKETNAFVMYG